MKECTTVVLGLLGSIASIIGAYLSFKHERKAKSYLSIIERTKKRVKRNQDANQLAKLVGIAKNTRDELMDFRVVGRIR